MRSTMPLLAAVAVLAGAAAAAGFVQVAEPLPLEWVVPGVSRIVSIQGHGRNVVASISDGCPDCVMAPINKLASVDLATRQVRIFGEGTGAPEQFNKNKDLLGDGWLVVPLWNGTTVFDLDTGTVYPQVWGREFVPQAVHDGYVYGMSNGVASRASIPDRGPPEPIPWKAPEGVAEVTFVKAEADRAVVWSEFHGADRRHHVFSLVSLSNGSEVVLDAPPFGISRGTTAFTRDSLIILGATGADERIETRRFADGAKGLQIAPPIFEKYEVATLTASDSLWVARIQEKPFPGTFPPGDGILAGTPDGRILVQVASEDYLFQNAVAAGDKVVYVKDAKLHVASPLDPKPVWPFLAGGVAVASGALAAWSFRSGRRPGDGLEPGA